MIPVCSLKGILGNVENHDSNEFSHQRDVEGSDNLHGSTQIKVVLHSK